MAHAEAIHAVAFSADGTLFATASKDDTAAVWELDGGDEVDRAAHKRDVDAVGFRSDGGSEGGARVVSADRDCASLWATDSDVVEIAVSFPGAITNRAIKISADGRFIVGAITDTVRVWGVDDGETLVAVHHPTTALSTVDAVAIGPDATIIASAGAKVVRVWGVDDGKELVALPHGSTVTSVAFSPDTQHLVTGSWDNTATVWDLVTGDSVLTLPHPNFVTDVAFSPDGRRIATACDDSVARVWEVDA